jgi:hypothetical protein
MDKNLNLYWIRHGESCANTPMNVSDEGNITDKPVEQTSSWLNKLSSVASTVKTVAAQLKNKAIYEPNLTSIGIAQADIASNKIYDIITNINTTNPDKNKKILFISSPMTRTITTALCATKQYIIQCKKEEEENKIIVLPYISETTNYAGDYDCQNSIVKSQDLIHRIKFIKDSFVWGYNHKIFYDINLLVDLLICINFDILKDIETHINKETYNFIIFLRKKKSEDGEIYFGKKYVDESLDNDFNYEIIKILIDFFRYQKGEYNGDQYISPDNEIIKLYIFVKDNLDKFPTWFKLKYEILRLDINKYITGAKVDFSEYIEIEKKTTYDNLNVCNYDNFMNILLDYLNKNNIVTNNDDVHIFIFSHGNFIKTNVCEYDFNAEGKALIDKYHEVSGAGGHIPNTCIILEKYNLSLLDIIYKQFYKQLYEKKLYVSEKFPKGVYNSFRTKLLEEYRPNLINDDVKYLYKFILSEDINICRSQSIKGFNNFYLPITRESALSTKKPIKDMDTMVQKIVFSEGKIIDKYAKYDDTVLVGGSNHYLKKINKYNTKLSQIK